MAVKQIIPGKVSVTTQAEVSAHAVRTTLLDAPGQLYPIRFAAFQTDDWRYGNGWPQQVPECDIRTEVLISSEGEYIGDRLDLVETEAYARWWVHEDSYSITDLRWQASQGAPMTFETYPSVEPLMLTEYEYRVGNELFLRRALSFDPDDGDFMEISMNQLGGTAGYSIVMVANLSAVHPDFSGIWCPTSTSGGYMSVTLQGTALYLQTDQTPNAQVLPLSNLLEDATPILLAFVFRRPAATFYAAAGPSAIVSGSTLTGSETNPLAISNYLGRHTTEGHNTDMALLDFGIYPVPLTAQQVKAEFTTLSALYGGDR